MSKKDLGRQIHNMRKRMEELEEKAKLDPLKKNFAIHDELAKLKKKLAEAQ